MEDINKEKKKQLEGNLLIQVQDDQEDGQPPQQ